MSLETNTPQTFEEHWTSDRWPEQFKNRPDATWTNEDLHDTAEEAYAAGVASQQAEINELSYALKDRSDRYETQLAEKEAEIKIADEQTRLANDQWIKDRAGYEAIVEAARELRNAVFFHALTGTEQHPSSMELRLAKARDALDAALAALDGV